MLDFEKVQTILDTFGRITRVALKNRGLWGFSSRMSKATYRLAYATYLRTYENWVIKLRLDYSRRQRSELPTEETGFLFSRWKTPTSSETEGGTLKSGFGKSKYKLRDQVTWATPTVNGNHNSANSSKKAGDGLSTMVKNQWPTPTATVPGDSIEVFRKRAAILKMEGKNGNGAGMNLSHAVQDWPTPSSRDYKGDGSKRVAKGPAQAGGCRLPGAAEIVGQQGQEKPSMTGKKPGLNPAWVMQLMGTTIEKTFFAWRETPLFLSKQNEHSEHF
jgi:hypothetical protein